MATITFDAKLYSAFKFNVYDGNLEAHIYSQGGLSLPDTIESVVQLRLKKGFNSRLRTVSTLSCSGGYLYKGGVAVLTNKFQSVASYRQYVDPTYVRIDIERLMEQGIPEQTDITFKLEEGWLIEDKYKYPSAKGYALPQNNNYLTIRTPTRLNRLTLGSQSSIDPDFPYRLRYFNNNNNQTVYSLFTPSCFAIGNFVGEIASGMFSNLSATVGAIYPETLNEQNVVSSINVRNTRVRILTDSLNYSVSSSLVNQSDTARIRFGVMDETITSNLTCDAYRIEGIILQVENFASLSCDATRIEMTYELDASFSFSCDPGFLKGIVNEVLSSSFTQLTIEKEFEGIILTVPIVATLNCVGGLPFAFLTKANPTLYLSGTVDAVINWGDGYQTVATSPGYYSHTYSENTIQKTVSIEGTCEEIGNDGSTWFCPTSEGVITLGEIGLRYISGMLKDRKGIAPAKLPRSLEEIPYLLYQTNTAYALPTQTVGYRNNIKVWDTSNITNMSYIFYRNTNSMEPLWLNWDVSNVTNFDYAFYQAGGVTTGFQYWTPTSGQTFRHMFEGALSMNFAVLDLPNNFVSSAATDISYMMGNLSQTKPRNVSNWDVSNVTNFNYAFYGETASTTRLIGMENWDVSSGQSFVDMIQSVGTQNFKNWNVSNITDPYGQGGWATSLTSGGQLPFWGYDGTNAVRGAYPITRSNTTIVSSNTQFYAGSKSIYIPENENIVIRPGYKYPTQTEWTVEGWFYLNKIDNASGVYIFNTDFSNNAVVYYSTSSDEIRFFYRWDSNNDGVIDSNSTYQGSSLADTTWHHFAYTMDYVNSTYKFFVNGTLVFTYTGPTGAFDPIDDFSIRLQNRYVDNFKISKGLKYTSSFTPTTTFTPDVDTVIFLSGENNVFDDPSA